MRIERHQQNCARGFQAMSAAERVVVFLITTVFEIIEEYKAALAALPKEGE